MERKKNIIRVLIGTVLILLVPLIAMQFSDEVQWGPLDFVFMFILLAGAGMLFVLVASKLGTKTYRRILGVATLLAVLAIWSELATDAVSSFVTSIF